jgi:hypothetical protein
MAIFFLDPQPGVPDGFDVATQYQMVPSGGVRRMALWVQASETEDVLVYCADPNKAHLFGLYAIQGSAANRGSGFFVKRDSAIRFFIGGRDPGPTTLIVESVRGAPRGFLLLSVKAQMRRTYQLGVLSDPIHVPAKELVGRNLATNMLAAEKVWLEQANVVLERVGPINDVVVPTDLGNPITIDDPAILTAIAQATVSTKLFVKADLFIYCTWDIVMRTNPMVTGFNMLNMCFIENQMSGRTGELVAAHEIGHSLGLPHSTGPAPLLMTGQGINSSFLDMWDIERANP